MYDYMVPLLEQIWYILFKTRQCCLEDIEREMFFPVLLWYCYNIYIIFCTFAKIPLYTECKIVYLYTRVEESDRVEHGFPLRHVRYVEEVL